VEKYSLLSGCKMPLLPGLELAAAKLYCHA
jgi:hypothetical protein